MNKKSKIYTALLLAAGAAWLCDRLIPGGGVTAPMASEASIVPVERPAGAAVQPKAPAESLAQRFARIGPRAATSSGAGEVSDLFCPPADWLPKAAPAEAAAPALRFYDIAGFEKAHKLTAVIRSKEHDCVMLDGRIVAVGQTLDGLTLVSTTESTATFRGEGVEVTLRLPLTAPGASPLAPSQRSPSPTFPTSR
jgi:hypothetical protein